MRSIARAHERETRVLGVALSETSSVRLALRESAHRDRQTIGKSAVGKFIVGDSVVRKPNVGRTSIGETSIGNNPIGEKTIDRRHSVGKSRVSK